MQQQLAFQQEENSVLPWENLHLDFHRAIRRRLTRRGELHLMSGVSRITDLQHLDLILEALLEGRSSATLHALLRPSPAAAAF